MKTFRSSKCMLIQSNINQLDRGIIFKPFYLKISTSVQKKMAAVPTSARTYPEAISVLAQTPS